MVKPLYQSLREYKRASWQTALFAALEVVLEILLPFLTAQIIDQGIYGGDMDTLIKLGLIMIVLVVLGLVSGLVAGPGRPPPPPVLPATCGGTSTSTFRAFPSPILTTFPLPAWSPG